MTAFIVDRYGSSGDNLRFGEMPEPQVRLPFEPNQRSHGVHRKRTRERQGRHQGEIENNTHFSTRPAYQH
jgi:hypothetical protein